MSDYLEMNLEQLQKEHAELLAFNEKLDCELIYKRSRELCNPKMADILESYFKLGKTATEIAKEMNIPTGTVKSNIFRGVKCLQESFS